MNLNTKGINTDTVTLTDYRMVADNLARVVIAYTGKHTQKTLSDSLAQQMEYMAAPVEKSFRAVRAGVGVGFVRANRAVRVEDEKEIRASYRVMASNILMDNRDQTLWELKEGAGGKYLARHGNEDLSELIEAHASSRPGVPGLRGIVMAKAAPREFVAFASTSGDMDYGFCTAVADDRLQVVSAAMNKAIVIPHEVVAQISQVKIRREDHERLIKAGLSRQEKSKEVEYYKRLYSYAPDYLQDVISQIEEGSML